MNRIELVTFDSGIWSFAIAIGRDSRANVVIEVGLGRKYLVITLRKGSRR